MGIKNNVKPTRLVLITEEGRICDYSNVEIKHDLQDSGRTLKLFLKDKK